MQNIPNGKCIEEGEERYLPLDLEGLTPELKLVAKTELNETEEKLVNGLNRLKELIKDEGIPSCLDDDFLSMFLRQKKYKMKDAFQNIKDYSYQRHAMMNYYGFMLADKIMPVMNDNILGILPKRDRHGRAIIYLRGRCFRSDIYDPDDVLRAAQAMGHFVLTFPATQVCGISLIVDCTVESMDLLYLGFKYVRFCLPTVKFFPGRFKKLDCVNANLLCRTLMAIVRPAFPAKLRDRISMHAADEKALLDTYDPSILPKEFGGTLGSLKEVSAVYLPQFEQYVHRLQASNQYFKRKDTIPFPES